MAPGRTLQRRQPDRGQRHATRVHAELGIDEHVQRVAADDRDRARRRPAGHLAHDVGARGKSLPERIDAGAEVIDVDVEALAVEPGDPVLEVPAHGAVAEERGDETDAPRPAGGPGA
jgi:hypothetical protein